MSTETVELSLLQAINIAEPKINANNVRVKYLPKKNFEVNSFFKLFKFNENENYSFELNFIFEDKFYFISDINNRTLYKNSYNHFISKDEILNIVNFISKKHIDYIDHIISNN